MRPILAIIVAAQFFCTSLWFAGNAVVGDISHSLGLSPRFLGHITTAVQIGFIAGTLFFALMGIADRYPASRVFFYSSLLAAFFNTAITLPGTGSYAVLLCRFATGFFLAGIYPVGMKIASDYFREGLGKSLGYLVGALVLGTAFPHLLKSLSLNPDWRFVLYGTSLLSLCGGIMILALVPDGPFHQKGSSVRLNLFSGIFVNPGFKSASLGYFGHMWEVYTYWAFVPVMLALFFQKADLPYYNIPFWSFICIAIGGPACVAGGYMSEKWGAKKVATGALLISCACCLFWPLVYLQNSKVLFLIYQLIWGATVATDSPLFSSLVARHAPADVRGSALTLVVCVGFAITIASIQTINWLHGILPVQYLYSVLAVGPLLGLYALVKISNST